ncbi:MAG: hypothetical protein QOE90_778 [Thermoplasmata archaeon]|jgi:hypothetical protein|nr:hypothetical protein [Thermoplasmata archaeon]
MHPALVQGRAWVGAELAVAVAWAAHLRAEGPQQRFSTAARLHALEAERRRLREELSLRRKRPRS